MRIDEPDAVAFGLALGEVEDPVLARVLAGHQRGPRGKRHGRDRRLQASDGAVAQNPGEVRQLALGHPRLDEVEGGPVEAEDENAPGRIHAECPPYSMYPRPRSRSSITTASSPE